MTDAFGALHALEPLALLELWTRALAARLLALAPGHPDLLAAARPAFGEAVDDRRALGAALERAQTLLLEALRARPADPLARACAAFGLSGFELDLLVLAMLPELDPRMGDVLATLRGGSGSRRPTVGLAARALAGEAPGLQLYAWLEGSVLWRADRELIPSPALRAGLLGVRLERVSGGRTLRDLEPDPDLRLILETRPALSALVLELTDLAARKAGVLHLVGPDREALRLCAAAVGARSGRPMLLPDGAGQDRRSGRAARAI